MLPYVVPKVTILITEHNLRLKAEAFYFQLAKQSRGAQTFIADDFLLNRWMADDNCSSIHGNILLLAAQGTKLNQGIFDELRVEFGNIELHRFACFPPFGAFYNIYVLPLEWISMHLNDTLLTNIESMLEFSQPVRHSDMERWVHELAQIRHILLEDLTGGTYTKVLVLNKVRILTALFYMAEK